MAAGCSGSGTLETVGTRDCDRSASGKLTARLAGGRTGSGLSTHSARLARRTVHSGRRLPVSASVWNYSGFLTTPALNSARITLFAFITRLVRTVGERASALASLGHCRRGWYTGAAQTQVERAPEVGSGSNHSTRTWLRELHNKDSSQSSTHKDQTISFQNKKKTLFMFLAIAIFKSALLYCPLFLISFKLFSKKFETCSPRESRPIAVPGIRVRACVQGRPTL